MVDARSRAAVEMAERLADGEVTAADVKQVWEEANRAYREVSDPIFRTSEGWEAEWERVKEDRSYCRAAQAATEILNLQAGTWAALSYSLNPSSPGYQHFQTKQRWQADIVRDLFGNPFRPAPQPKRQWLTWNNGMVVAITHGIYAERAFDRLPILAEALLDAGCDDDVLLGHLRGPGPHVLGCWALDILLGKS